MYKTTHKLLLSLLLSILLFTPLYGQTMTMTQGNDPAKGMTRENPQLRGGRTIWITGLPLDFGFPHWNYWLERNGRRSSASLLLYNGDVISPAEGSVGPANLTVSKGNIYAQVNEPVEIVVTCDLGDIHLEARRWIRADCFKEPCPGAEPDPDPDPIPEPDPDDPCAICAQHPQLCPPECFEPQPPAERYVYLENQHLKVRMDLRSCGAVDFISLDGGPNLVDSADNGRLIQADMQPGQACCEDNEFPDNPHRRISTPTQGGGYKKLLQGGVYQQLPNWPLVYSVSETGFTSTCRMIEYWDPSSSPTPYLLDWEVEVVGYYILVTGRIYTDSTLPEPVDLATVWFYGSDVFSTMPSYERWVVDNNFLESDSIELEGVKLISSGKPVLAWVNEDTGASSWEFMRPQGVTLMSGFRYWPSKYVTQTDSVVVSMYLDLSGKPSPAPPDESHITIIRILSGLDHKMDVLFKVLCEDHGMNCEKVKEYLGQ